MANETVIAILQEAVRSAIYEAATEEIKQQTKQFEMAMVETKRKVVNEIVNTIQIQAMQNLPTGEYTIQIKLNGGK